MIRGTGYHHNSVVLVRVPPRHGGSLLPMQFTAITSTQMTTPTILKLPSSTVMPRSSRSGRDGQRTTIQPGTQASQVKSP